MNFIARVEDSQREKIRQIARSLENMGVRVREVLPLLGLISGSSEALSLEQVKVKGIVAVELDRKWGAGMPESVGEEKEGAKVDLEKVTGAKVDSKESKAKLVKGVPNPERKRVVAKRSGGKARRKD